MAAFTIPDPVAVVNGKAISRRPSSSMPSSCAARPRSIRRMPASRWSTNVMEELLVQQAHQQKLEDDPQIKQQLEMIQRSLLASTVVRRMLSENAPSEDAIKKGMGKPAVAAMSKVQGQPSWVDSEDKAKEVIAELKKGGKFARTGQGQISDSSAANGGDLAVHAEHDGATVRRAVAKMERASTARSRCRLAVRLARHPAGRCPRRQTADPG